MSNWLYDLFVTLWHFPPEVGVCIGILALVAVVMTARGEKMTTKETIVWVLVSFGLMLGEVYAIHHKDASDNQAMIESRAAEDSRFANVLMQNQREFEATVHGFDITVGELHGPGRAAEAAINTSTGGDSYCFVDRVSPDGGVTIIKTGKFPLYDVQMTISDSRLTEIGISNLHNLISALTRDTEPVLKMLNTQDTKLFFTFVARNGIWQESFVMKNNLRALRVYATPPTAGTPKPIFTSTDNNFPLLPNGEVDWYVPEAKQ